VLLVAQANGLGRAAGSIGVGFMGAVFLGGAMRGRLAAGPDSPSGSLSGLTIGLLISLRFYAAVTNRATATAGMLKLSAPPDSQSLVAAFAASAILARVMPARVPTFRFFLQHSSQR